MEPFRQAPASLPPTVFVTVSTQMDDFGRVYGSTYEPFRGRMLAQLIDEGWFVQLLGQNGQMVLRRMG